MERGRGGGEERLTYGVFCAHQTQPVAEGSDPEPLSWPE